MTNVLFAEKGTIYGAINVRSAQEFESFGKGKTVHLTQLDDAERIKRWKEIWFSNVKIEHSCA